MSSIDPENGDIIENPDPEADSEIDNFANATEDEFQLNNNAEDEFQLHFNAKSDNVNENVDDSECAQENNLCRGDSLENCPEVGHRNSQGKETQPEELTNGNPGGAVECDEDNSELVSNKIVEDTEEPVEADADNFNSFESPEAELGNDKPEAELCQENSSLITEAESSIVEAELCQENSSVSTTEAESSIIEAELCQGTTSDGTEAESCIVSSEPCQTQDDEPKFIPVDSVLSPVKAVKDNEQKVVAREVMPDAAERGSPVGNVHVLKLTKSESVESYEPECDQETLSPSHNIAASKVVTSDDVSPIHTSEPCNGSHMEERFQNSLYNDNAEGDEVESNLNGEISENATSKSVCKESENAENFNNNKTKNKAKNEVQENETSQHEVCVQNKSNNESSQTENSSVTNLQMSCDDCGSGHKNSGKENPDVGKLTQTKNVTNDQFCEVNNVKESSHRKEVLNQEVKVTVSDQEFCSHQKDKGQENVSDDDLLSELDSELGSNSQTDQKHKTEIKQSTQSCAVHAKANATDARFSGFEDVPISRSEDMSEETWKIIQNLQQKLNVSRQKQERQERHIQRSQADYTELHQRFESIIEERDSYLKEIDVMKKHNSDDYYLPQIKELEYTISQQQQEIRGFRDKLSSHDNSAKRAINGLQAEMKQRVEQMTKAYKEAVAEKDNMVIKYAQAEKNNLGNLKNIERLESNLKNAAKEKESLLGKIKDLKIEKTRLGHELDLKSSEAQTAKKESEKLKEQVSSADVRIKWAQNKLKAELDSHKETKASLEKTTQRLNTAKEETEQIRRNCQEIIKTYQESEEIKSNSLDQQLKEKQNELLLHQTENKDKEEIYTATIKELEQLKKKHREILAELSTYQDKTMCLEEEHKSDEDTLNKFKHMLQKQKADNKDLQDKVEQMVQLQADFKRAQHTIKALDAEVSELKISNKDLNIEMEACGKREAEKLELTERLSAKNAELQSDNSLLNDKVMALSVELENLKMDLQSNESSLEETSKTLSDETARNKQEISQLKEKLAEKSKKVDELSTKIEDEKDEIKTLKRKHINSIKDLTRQLQQARRKLETYEANGDKDTTSLGSRTSSTGSLNTIPNGDGPNHSVQQVPAHTYRQPSPPEQEYPVITEQVEPDKQMLIERIVKLQRMLARRNEKIEFMEDHAHQLVDDLQKKKKIIQMYALREESGMLTAESVDASKAQLARKQSIMGSVYNSHSTDGTMTMDLSLEINRKLQAVLEDTLIKNMTLKESLDTLGEEIARLSQENRKMQIQLDQLKR